MSSPLSERTKQRRRLLKAVAGVPAIVVLPAGAQTAASSVTCVRKGLDANTPPRPAETVSATDQWVRQQVPGSNPPEYKLVLDPDTTSPTYGEPVAYASCWNSLYSPPAASGTNLIP